MWRRSIVDVGGRETGVGLNMGNCVEYEVLGRMSGIGPDIL